MQKNKVSKVCSCNSFLLKVYVELYSMLCGSWDGSLGRTDTCICLTESLHCSPESITTLLIGYTSIQKEKRERENNNKHLFLNAQKKKKRKKERKPSPQAMHILKD